MIAKSPANYDTIVYGYAFRNHWMWINGVSIHSDTTNVLAYIIWKDYNCQAWSVFSGLLTSISTFTEDQRIDMYTYAFSGVETDVWGAAYAFVEFLNAKSSFSSGAYTVVMSQYATAIIRGYVCVVNKNYSSVKNIQASGSDTYGSYFLFQTR